MSLSTIEPIRQYNLGIICSKSLDNPDFLFDLIYKNLAVIKHIYTNGANSLVTDFAKENGISYTVYPINCRSLPWSNSRIIESSEFVFILCDDDSKSAKLAKDDCEKHRLKNPKFSYKIVKFDPIQPWKQKMVEVTEIINLIPKEDLEKNEALKAIAKIL